MRLRLIILFSLALLLTTSKPSYSTDDVTALTAGPVGLFFKGKKVVGQKDFPKGAAAFSISGDPGWHIWAKIYFNEEEIFTLNYKFGDENFAKQAGLEIYPPSRKTLTITNDFQTISSYFPREVLPPAYKKNTVTIRIKGFIVYPDRKVVKFDTQNQEAGETTCKGIDCECINIEFSLKDPWGRLPNIQGCG